MNIHRHQYRTERFERLGRLVEENAAALTDRWMTRAVEEQPHADPERRQVMYDELPQYLGVLGRQLACTGTSDTDTQSQLSAEEHGKQRWHVGWSLEEVVRDYQIMRLVIIQFLDETLDESLTIDEILAVNLTLDEAITGAVLAYVAESQQRYRSLNDNLDQKVRERTGQLRELARALIDAEQRERRRLAQVLHEHVQQLLFAARMRVQNLSDVVPETSSGVLQETDDLLKQAINDARSLAISLSPPSLHEEGLANGLQVLRSEMAQRHGLTFDLIVEGNVEPRSSQTRELIYQTIRELLLNVAKHSGQSSAQVRLERLDFDWLRVIVEDQGNGVPHHPADSPQTQAGGFGLADIRQRSEVLGGTMSIRPVHPQGTSVVIELPAGD